MPKTPINLDNYQFHDRLTWFLGVGLGTGLSPKAPGTVGSFVALFFFPLWVYIGFWPTLIAVIVAALLGIYICGRTAEIMQVHDDARIVWDEFVGQWIALLPFIPFLYEANCFKDGDNLGDFIWCAVLGLISFALFRLFDIWKPWPISWADKKLSGGFGIMFDDILAGIFVIISLLIFAHLVLVPFVNQMKFGF